MRTYSVCVWFSLCLCILRISAIAQDSLNVKRRNKLLIGTQASPDYSFRTLTDNAGTGISKMILDADNKTDAPKLGYTAGVVLSYNFTKDLGLGTGFLFSNKGFQTKDMALVWGSAPPRRGFTVNSPTITSAHFRYNLYYIDMPLKFYFSGGKNKLRFIAGAGITTSIFLAATTVFKGKDSDGTVFSETSKSSFTPTPMFFSAEVSLGVDYSAGKRIHFRWEPIFRYGLEKMNDSPISATLWSAGINMGCYYAF